MDKRRRMSAWLRGDGIEIGALNLPLGVNRRARVRYVDRLPVEGQRRAYPELATEELAPVDVNASAEDLSPFGDASLDFVIANHLLEHLEDPSGPCSSSSGSSAPAAPCTSGCPTSARPSTASGR